MTKYFDNHPNCNRSDTKEQFFLNHRGEHIMTMENGKVTWSIHPDEPPYNIPNPNWIDAEAPGPPFSK